MGKKITYLLAYIILIGINWGVVCGLVKLITLCFGLGYSLPIATGIWLILILLKSTNRKN